MVRRLTSVALGIFVTCMATAAFAQGQGGDAPPDDSAAAAPTGGDAAAAGDAAPADDASGADATPAGNKSSGAAKGDAAPGGVSTADAGAKKNAIGADVGVLIPVGNLGNATSLMLGAALKYEMDLSPKLGVTGRIGYFYGFSKSVGPVKYNMSDLPIWVGGRYYFMGGAEGVHLGAEIGLNYLFAHVGGYTASVGGASFSVPSTTTSKAYFGFNIPVGYKIGDLDIQAQYSMLDVGHAGDTQAVGITVGYNFVKF